MVKVTYREKLGQKVGGWGGGEKEREESAGMSSEEHPPKCRCPSLMQQMIHLKTLSHINTNFHQDLLEVPAGCSCLCCLYHWLAGACCGVGRCCMPVWLLSFVKVHYGVSK